MNKQRPIKFIYNITGIIALIFSVLTGFGQTTYSFSTCGASGTSGPTQAQANSSYSATSLAGLVTVTGSGIQQWIVPATGIYTLTASGASGGYTPNGHGGKGRVITTQLSLTAGTVLNILVGQEGGRAQFSSGSYGPGYSGGGGGGTFIINQSTMSPILICGGGGGAGEGSPSFAGSSIQPGVDAAAYNVTSGTNGTGYSGSWSTIGIGGTNGSGGTASSGGSAGGGYTGNGQTGSYAGIPGNSYTNGGAGGINRNMCGGSFSVNVPGGFGGGAGAGICAAYEANGGGGGGYSGGGGSNTRVGAGGGGGNFYTGTFVSTNVSTGNGSVVISAPAVSPAITAGTISGTIAGCVGTASAGPNVQQFTVAGNNLTGNITATAPTGFEISFTLGSGYGNTLSFTESAGIVNSTTVYVRSAASASTGNISGNVVLSSASATSMDVAVSGTVNALPTVAAITGTTTVCTASTTQLSDITNGGIWSSSNTSIATVDNSGKVSGVTTGICTISYVVTTNGCATTASASLLVNTLPVAAITAAGPATFCAGGSVTLSSTGSSLGDALSFNGVNQYVNVTPTASINSLGLSGFTLEAWVYPTDVSGVKSILRKTGDYNLYIIDGSVAAEVWPNGIGDPTFIRTTPVASNVLSNNTWAHVAATWNKTTNTILLYVNGVAVSSSTVTFPVGGTEPLLIGLSSIYGQPFAGKLDEVRIWDTDRTATQIANSRNAFIASNTPHFVAYYKFDEGTGTTTADATGKGNNGVLVNGPTWVIPSDVPVTYSSYTWLPGGATTSSISATASGNYTLTVSDVNGCSATSSPITVAVNPLPVVYNVTGGGIACAGGVAIGLDGSQTGVNYQLKNGPANVGSPVAGTNAAITFGNQSAAGTYTVIATGTGSCTSAMTGSAMVTTGAAPSFTNTNSSLQGIAPANGCSIAVSYALVASGSPAPAVTYVFTGATSGSGAGTGSGDLFSTGVTNVTVTASNTCGTVVNNFTVTITDNTAPVLTGVPTNITAECSAVPAMANVSASDNCSGSGSVNAEQFPSSTLSALLVHNYTYNSSSADSKGSANGTNVNGVSFTQGIIGNAAQFNGSNYLDYGTAASINGAVPFAISVWVKTASAGQQTIIQQRDGNINGQYILNIGANHAGTISVPGRVYFMVYNGGFQFEIYSSNRVDDNKWHHIVAERDGTNGRIFIDGVLAGSGTGPLLALSSVIGTYVGRDVRDGGKNFVGQMDELKIFAGNGSNCISTYDLERTWSVKDASGNQSAAQQIISVHDTQAPVLSAAPANVTIECSDPVPAAATLTATDNCDASPIVTYAEVRTNGANASNYVLTRTWTATDACGNASSKTQTITVQDITKPVITVPASVTLNCQDDNSTSATGIATGTDNCGPVTITYSDVSTQVADINNAGHYNYTITRTWTATDITGNNISDVQTITVQDITAPVITVPLNVTLNCQDDNSTSATGVATGTDNCGPITITYGDVSTQVADINNAGHYNYTITRTWTATDVTGNSISGVQTITVQDITAPVITVPLNVTLNCQDDNSTSATGVATGTDNCGPITITYSDVSTQVADINNAGHYNYTITRTWTATDVTGNNISGTQTITVQDITKPVITVPLNVTLNCQDNTTTAATGIAAGTDNCGPVTITYSDVSTQVADINNAGHYNYTITRTWTATDVTGNNISGVQTITVQDITAPVITVPLNVTLNCQDNTTAAATGVATGTDNCGPVAITYSDVSTQVADINNAGHYNYTITRTWTATDVTGNNISGVQTITVQDITAPVITVPLNVTLNCQDNTTAAATGVATGTDNCGPVAITYSDVSTQVADINNAGHYNYTITRTWTATDVTGNNISGVQIIKVQDITKPAIIIPASVTLNCQDNTTTAATGIATGTDNCGPVAITYSDVSTQVASITDAGHYNYTITRTWTATDITGNNISGAQTIKVQDITKPAIIVPASVTLNCQDNNTTSATGVATGTDNCGPVTITYSDASTQVASVTDRGHYNYTITRTWTATDVTGNNISGVQIIKVQDVTKPAIIVPASVTLNCQDNNTTSATGVATGTDNCGPVTITYSDVSTQVASATDRGHYNYTITRTWTATDVTGNNISGIQIIKVQDITKPVIVTCPSNVTQCNDQAGNTRSFIFIATDNCSPLTTTYTITGPGGTINGSGNTITTGFPIGTTTINWTVKDVSGNTSTCSTTVVINPLPVAGITTSTADGFCNKFVLTGNSTLTGPFGYQWLYNNQSAGTSQQLSLGLSNGDGIYTLYTTDVNGCKSAAGATYNYQKQNLASSYTIIGFREVDLGQDNTVQSGSVGVTAVKGGQAEIGKNVSIASPGAFLKAARIDVDGTSNIPTKVYSAAIPVLPTMIYNASTTRGLADYQMRTAATATVNGNYNNVYIKKGSVVTLTGSVYGNITIEKGATIIFKGSPVVNISNLSAGSGGDDDNGGNWKTNTTTPTVYTTIRFAQATNVLVSSGVSIANQSQVNPDNNKVTFYVGHVRQSGHGNDERDHECDYNDNDETSFRVTGGDTKVIANVYMPNGKLEVDGVDGGDDDHKSVTAAHCYMTGLFIANTVESDSRGVIWNSYDCSAPVTTVTNGITQVTQSTVSEKTAVVSTEEELKVTVMPNPSTTYFTLKLESKYETPVNMRVMDSRGRVVDAKSKIGSNSTIQIGHNYASGTYYAELIQGTKRKVVQLIKGRG